MPLHKQLSLLQLLTHHVPHARPRRLRFSASSTPHIGPAPTLPQTSISPLSVPASIPTPFSPPFPSSTLTRHVPQQPINHAPPSLLLTLKLSPTLSVQSTPSTRSQQALLQPWRWAATPKISTMKEIHGTWLHSLVPSSSTMPSPNGRLRSL